MTMRTKDQVLCYALLGLTVGVAASGRAETTQCTAVSAVPAIIDTPGVYCLTADLEFAPPLGAAIRIEASDVLLDLNGHTLSGPGASGTQAYGILADERANVRVRNGVVRGFNSGIFLTGSPSYLTYLGYVVEDIRAEHNTEVGIDVEGRASVVRHNLVLATGGTDVAQAFGIAVCGGGVRVVDNDVTTVSKQKGGLSYGIFFCTATVESIALNNRITRADRGIYMGTSATTVKYRDNLTLNVTIPYVQGTDAGNNN
jgi:hypothetical protein